MKKIFIFLTLLFISATGFSQNGFNLKVNSQLGVNIRNSDNAFKSISPSDINNIKTLSDLKEGFPDSWIKSYESVVIGLTSNGTSVSSENAAHELASEQMELIKNVNYGDEISVNVSYYSNNPNATKELKTMTFAYVVTPEFPAACDGGYEGMERYLTTKTLKDLSFADQEKIKNVKARFTIDKTGSATNATLIKSSDNERLDKMVLQTLNSMPKWAPAKSSNGNNVSQSFVFSVGNMIGC